VREIGVRRALGAKRNDILIQILGESVTLAGAGGLLGMVASVGLIKLLQKIVVEGNRPELSPAALVIGVVFSGLVGIVAGLYPAIRASRLSPGGSVALGLSCVNWARPLDAGRRGPLARGA